MKYEYDYITIYKFTDIILNLNTRDLKNNIFYENKFISPKDINLLNHKHYSYLDNNLYKFQIIDKKEDNYRINLILIINILNDLLKANKTIPNSNFLSNFLKNDLNISNNSNTLYNENYNCLSSNIFFNLETKLEELVNLIFYKKKYNIPRNDYIKIGDYWLNIEDLSYYNKPPRCYLLNIMINHKIILYDTIIFKTILDYVSKNYNINSIKLNNEYKICNYIKQINDIVSMNNIYDTDNKKCIFLVLDNSYYNSYYNNKSSSEINISNNDDNNDDNDNDNKNKNNILETIHINNLDEDDIYKINNIFNLIYYLKSIELEYHLLIEEKFWLSIDDKTRCKIIKVLLNINSKTSVAPIPTNFLSYHLIINASSKYLINNYNIEVKKVIKPIYIKPDKTFYNQYNLYLKEPKNCETDKFIINMISCSSYIPIIKTISIKSIYNNLTDNNDKLIENNNKLTDNDKSDNNQIASINYKNNILKEISNKNLLTCSICLNKYDINYLLFGKCFHQICKNCMINYMNLNLNNSKIKCSICRCISIINDYYQISRIDKSPINFIQTLYKTDANIANEFIGVKTLYLINFIRKNIRRHIRRHIGKNNNNYYIFIYSNKKWKTTFTQLLLEDNKIFHNGYTFMNWENLSYSSINIDKQIFLSGYIKIVILDPIMENPKVKDGYIRNLHTLINLYNYHNDTNYNYGINQLVVKDTIDDKIIKDDIVFY